MAYHLIVATAEATYFSRPLADVHNHQQAGARLVGMFNDTQSLGEDDMVILEVAEGWMAIPAHLVTRIYIVEGELRPIEESADV